MNIKRATTACYNYACEYCEAEFKTLGEYIAHLNDRVGELQKQPSGWRCGVCDTEWTFRGAATYGLCPVCDEERLERMKPFKDDAGEYTCMLCEEDCGDLEGLHKHLFDKLLAGHEGQEGGLGDIEDGDCEITLRTTKHGRLRLVKWILGRS